MWLFGLFLLSLRGLGCNFISAAAAGRDELVRVSLVCTEPVWSTQTFLWVLMPQYKGKPYDSRLASATLKSS